MIAFELRTSLICVLVFLPSRVLVAGQSASTPKHTAMPHDSHHSMDPESRADEPEDLTRRVSNALPPSKPLPVEERNYIDKYIFQKIRQDKIPHASLCSDTEFLRRVSLDLTGRLPEPEKIREFVKDPDPHKREKLVEAIMATSTKGVVTRPSTPFLDRWAYFFCDLFHVNGLTGKGRTLFYHYIYDSLVVNQPYDQLVREILTTTTKVKLQLRARQLSGPILGGSTGSEHCEPRRHLRRMGNSHEQNVPWNQSRVHLLS